MRLLTLAGAYAGQVRDYGTVAGLAALRSGTARRVGDAGPVIVTPAPAAVVPSPMRTAQAKSNKPKTKT